MSDVYRQAAAFVLQQCPECLSPVRDPRAGLPKEEYLGKLDEPFEFTCYNCGTKGMACYSLEWHIKKIVQGG